MQTKFQHLDEHLICGNMPHIQNWPFPPSGCTSPLKSPYCSLHCAGLQLSLELKVWDNLGRCMRENVVRDELESLNI